VRRWASSGSPWRCSSCTPPRSGCLHMKRAEAWPRRKGLAAAICTVRRLRVRLCLQWGRPWKLSPLFAPCCWMTLTGSWSAANWLDRSRAAPSTGGWLWRPTWMHCVAARSPPSHLLCQPRRYPTSQCTWYCATACLLGRWRKSGRWPYHRNCQ